MSYYDILLAKKLSGGGGGITTEPLSVTANDTYTAPSGKAYTPVTVNVPNPSTGTLNITANGTYDVMAYASALVSVSGGGGSGLEYESGTWTAPTTTPTRTLVPFQNSHTYAPSVFLILNTRSTSVAKGEFRGYYYIYSERLMGVYPLISGSATYGYVLLITRGINSSNESGGQHYLTVQDTDSGDSQTSMPRYWVTNEGFYPYSGSNWRTDFDYKWIAIWVPTS